MATTSQTCDIAKPVVLEQRLRTHAVIFGNVSVWLMAALSIGGAIAIYDGMHRKWMTELEAFGPVVPLSYTANRAAWLFAGLALPLLIVHGRKMRMPFLVSFLLWFVVSTAAYAKDFAYLKIPGVPVFITDVTLVLALVSAFVWPRLRIPKLTSGVVLLVAGFLLIGMLEAVRGLRNQMAVTDVLRDASVPVYTVFMLAGLYARRCRSFTRQYLLMIVGGAVLATLVGLSWYLMQPGMRRYVMVEVYVALAFLLMAIAMLSRQVPLRIGLPLLGLLAVGVLLCNARSVYVGLAASFGLLLLTSLGKGRARTVAIAAAIVFAVLAILVTVLLQKREYAQPGRQNVPEVLATAKTDDNTQWRLLAWKEAGRRFLREPIFGEGYGVPFTFDLISTDTKPHNIYLYVLYKMGLVGAAVFLTLLLVPTIAAWRAIRRHATHPDAVLLQALFLSQFFLFCWGALNPLIETPFLAGIFWLNFGLMLRMALRIERGGATAGTARVGPLSSFSAQRS